jgi:hypothetical protein
VKNPFDELGLSPTASVDEITAELRERAEDASEEERKALRRAWEELTMHPRSRLVLALTTFPDAGDRPPRPPPLRAAPSAARVAPTLLDLAPRPSVEAALSSRRGEPRAALPPIHEDRLAFGEEDPKDRRKQNP